MPMRIGPIELLLALLCLVVPIVITVTIVVIIQAGKRSAPAPTQGTGRVALEIAKERYARGEITAEQYDEMRRKLGQ